MSRAPTWAHARSFAPRSSAVNVGGVSRVWVSGSAPSSPPARYYPPSATAFLAFGCYESGIKGR
eukprot:11209046-Lingulodinium_polyedra.AAC.1